MKNAYIIHGLESSPEGNWFPWLKRELELRDYSVTVPAMPHPNQPKEQEWVECLRTTVRPGPDTLLVGHSLAGIAIFRYLASLPKEETVGQVIVVGAFIHSLHNPKTDNFFQQSLDCAAVRQHCRSIIAISSSDDPHVPQEEAWALQENLGAKLTIVPEAGHLNAAAGFTAFPLILKFLA